MVIAIINEKTERILADEFINKLEKAGVEVREYLIWLSDEYNKACLLENNEAMKNLALYFNDCRGALDRLFDIYCGNSQQLVRTFKLPCSDQHFEQMTRVIGMDGVESTEFDYRATVLNAPCQSIHGMSVKSPNFQELNAFADKLDKMTSSELDEMNDFVITSKKSDNFSPKALIRAILIGS